MRKPIRSVLVAVTVALTAVGATVPTSASSAGAGQPTGLNVSWTWVHFLPTVESDHLTVNQGDDIAAVCKVSRDSTLWNLVYDRTTKFTGYTYASYLTTPSTTDCASVGTSVKAGQALWVHLYPQANWEYQVVNAADILVPVCGLVHHDPSDNSTRFWDLVIDQTNGLTGFTWNSAVGVNPPPCD